MVNHRDAATEVRNASTGVGWQSGDRVTTSLNIAGFVRLSACTVQVTSPVIVLSVVFGTIRTLNSFGSNECVKGGGIVDHCGPFLNIYYTEGFSGSSVYSGKAKCSVPRPPFGPLFGIRQDRMAGDQGRAAPELGCETEIV